MSTFGCPIVEIGKVGKHPNADTLSITQVEGCPVIFRTDDYKPGDLAIYIPVDSVVPLDREVFKFLAKKEFQKTARVKAAKLRGIFSMGLLVPITALTTEPRDDLGKPLDREHLIGTNVATDLGVVKYEEPEENMSTAANRERDPGFCPVYDIESYRKYKYVFTEGEQVVVTEKIHGCNARFAFRKEAADEQARLYVGSHHQFKKDGENIWWQVARQYMLAETMEKLPGKVLYGEVFGQVQDLKYGTTKERPLLFRAFDIYDTVAGRFMDWPSFRATCNQYNIPYVPVLYEGPYSPTLIEPMSEGKSTLADQIKEGFVIKPVTERWERATGRVILKLISEQYLLRKDGTERH